MSPPLTQPDHGSIAHELAMLRQELASNTKETREVKHLLTGNGEPERGVIVRLDRIEQREHGRSKLAWASFGVAGTALVAAGKAILFDWHK